MWLSSGQLWLTSPVITLTVCRKYQVVIGSRYSEERETGSGGEL